MNAISVAIAYASWAIAPVAPIGGCDAPHPASNVEAAPMATAKRLSPKLFISQLLALPNV